MKHGWKGSVPTAENAIGAYMHCERCLKELPAGISPQDWASLSVGFTRIGLQVWCNRHECNVAHIDFEGHKHPANVTAKKERES